MFIIVRLADYICWINNSSEPILLSFPFALLGSTIPYKFVPWSPIWTTIFHVAHC